MKTRLLKRTGRRLHQASLLIKYVKIPWPHIRGHGISTPAGMDAVLLENQGSVAVVKMQKRFGTVDFSQLNHGFNADVGAGSGVKVEMVRPDSKMINSRREIGRMSCQ